MDARCKASSRPLFLSGGRRSDGRQGDLGLRRRRAPAEERRDGDQRRMPPPFCRSSRALASTAQQAGPRRVLTEVHDGRLVRWNSSTARDSWTSAGPRSRHSAKKSANDPSWHGAASPADDGPLVSAPQARPAPGDFRGSRWCLPFLAEEGLGSSGMLIGQDAWSGAAFCYDPWSCTARERSPIPTSVSQARSAGEVHPGKVSAARCVAFGRRVYVPGDPKGSGP